MSAALEWKDVSKRYGVTEALKQVSLAVEPGQMLGLIGPNGAGKTTLFSIACGFVRPTAGEAFVFGVPARRAARERNLLGVLPQDAQLPKGFRVGPWLTSLARLSGLAAPEAEARAALERVGLASAWGQPATGLSHGMAKRVALAQALMGSPRVLLLDEPTAGLDPRSAAAVRGLLREQKGKATVVVSSHNLEELESLCDATAVLDRGSLVAAATMAEMTRQGLEFQVSIARGTPVLEALQLLLDIKAVAQSGNELRIQTLGKRPPEDTMTAVLELLIAQGVKVNGLKSGATLEQAVLQIT